ncbi:MAG: putative arsenical pump-driving ATPase [Candidatus Bathyarchaeota archaeon BA1]|nr:MAG: putative arsenical pump-driving ATPase [Candidatus Bathyarchaeota archaeon BA1]
MPETMREFFEKKRDLSCVIFAGKGGLGKTTFSAATAYWLAKQNRKSLCFSTDPQASLSDIFERDIFGKGIQSFAPNLCVLEIDADRRVMEYQEEVRKKILDMYSLEEVPKEVDEYIRAAAAEPAMHESATYDAMAELMAKKEYDYYIFDMPPFGHGVRMVSMALMLDMWIDKITEARKVAEEYKEVISTLRGGRVAETEDVVFKELTDIRVKLDFFKDILTDSKRTAFFMVLIPERMAILDTEKALDMFNKMEMTLSGIIVNMVYPVELLERRDLSDFLKHRIEMQQKYMTMIWEKFEPYVRAVVPMYEREPKGLEMIAKVSNDLFGWKP